MIIIAYTVAIVAGIVWVYAFGRVAYFGGKV